MSTTVPGTGICPLLPDWHTLYAALSEAPSRDAGSHPVVRCARALAECYREPHTSTPRIAALQHAELITVIDNWIARHARHPRRADVSIGAYIDRMACATVQAERLLADGPVGEPLLRAWWTLADLAAGWADLTADLSAPYRV
jgi:hypothetical protein